MQVFVDAVCPDCGAIGGQELLKVGFGMYFISCGSCRKTGSVAGSIEEAVADFEGDIHKPRKIDLIV